MSTLSELIPPSRICPLCLRQKMLDSQWVRTNMGDAVCRACTKQFPELSAMQYTPKIPEECPVCERHTARGEMHKIRFWVKTKSMYLCGDCAKLKPLVGTYRVDVRGRELRVVREGLGAYTFGVSRINGRTYASTLARFMEQQLRMWAIVSSRMSLCDKVANWFTPKTSQLWDDLQSVALEGLCRASVEMMWNYDHTRGAFDSYATRSMINTCKNYLKAQARLSLSREEFTAVHELMLSEREEDDESQLRGPEAAQIVERLIETLGETDVFILTRRFVDGASFEEIGCELGVLRSAVHNRWAKIKARVLHLI